MSDVSLVILHYKRTEDTLSCLATLKRHGSFQDFSVIVVSNAPADSFPSQVASEYPDVSFIQNPRNFGFSGGNNVGIRKAIADGSEFIFLLNPDTLFHPRVFLSMVSSVKQDQSIGILSPKIRFAIGHAYHAGRYSVQEADEVLWYAGGIIDWANVYASHRGVDEVDRGQYDEKGDTDFATGCCMMMRRSLISAIGGFDEKYFLYYEDVDLCVRAKKHGFRVVYDPSVYINHKNALSSGKPGSPLHVYYQTRNRLYFGNLYAGWRARKSLFLESVLHSLSGRVKRRAVYDYYFGRMGGTYA